MAHILKDYKCLACRHMFESWEPICPECGSNNVATMFLQAPAIRTSSSPSKKYPDEFTYKVCEARSEGETTDAVGNELFRDGDPRPGHNGSSRMGSGMAWGDNQARELLAPFGLSRMITPRTKKRDAAGNEYSSLPVGNMGDRSAETALKFARENKSRIMAP